jgi:NTP pyrophosphatase (non-canonical NTP hydrolase)
MKRFIYNKLEIRNLNMTDFTLNEMQEMQKRLQNKYKDQWEPISPETGKNKLLWMIGEVGEVIDIVKKYGDLKAITDTELRKALVEEMADILMYYNDVMLCYGISADELKQSYTEKFEKNMTRW